MIENLVHYKEGEQSWIRYIKKRLDNGLNFLPIITGATGVGKTYFGLGVALKLDPEFNPREQIAFKFYDLMAIINNFNNKKHPLSKKKYKVALFDEPQTSISNKEWQSKVNKLFNYLVSTFRHQHICLIFCTPYSDFVDLATQKLLHAELSCRGWNKKTKKSKVRPLLLQYNPNKKKMYNHFLRVKRNKTIETLKEWTMNIPKKEAREVYEVMKIEFTQKLNEKITIELAKEEGIFDDKKDKYNRKPLTDIQKETMIIIAKYEGNMMKAIGEIKKNPTTVYFHRRKAEKKGYTWHEFSPEQLEKAKIP